MSDKYTLLRHYMALLEGVVKNTKDSCSRNKELIAIN